MFFCLKRALTLNMFLCSYYLKRTWLFLCLILASCQAEAPFSRKYSCQFVFSYDQHPTSLLFAAARSAGTYVYVTASGDGSSSFRHIYVTSNDGKTPREDNVISTEIEKRTACILGASNNIGIIIGMTNFNGLWAYDRSCPNCTNLQALDWTGNRQQVACPKCKRTYELETGNIIDGDPGEALLRYFCSFDGTILHAWN